MTEALIEVSLLLLAATLGVVIFVLLPSHWKGLLIIAAIALIAMLALYKGVLT
jgi:hypothetical protein